MKQALVLPGAVARGAFEAGVLKALVECEVPIARIVATSSGALNGLAFAAGIRAGKSREMTERLLASWIKDGSWETSLNVNVWGLLRGRGLSSAAGLRRLMRNMVEPCQSSQRFPVELRIIVTPLDGVREDVGTHPATTYEHVLTFADADFDSPEKLEEIFTAVCAACAFPILFEPVRLPGVGPCVDGGAVNNAPIRYALEANDVNRVIMPVPFPAVMPGVEARGRIEFVNHLIEILINERLHRDLKVAENVNEEWRKLEALNQSGTLSADQVEAVREALGIRRVGVVVVRPTEAWKTSPFAGFFQQTERERLIQEGYAAAMATFARELD